MIVTRTKNSVKYKYSSCTFNCKSSNYTKHNKASLQLKFDKGKKKSGRLGRKIKGKLYLLGLENECATNI